MWKLRCRRHFYTGLHPNTSANFKNERGRKSRLAKEEQRPVLQICLIIMTKIYLKRQCTEICR